MFPVQLTDSLMTGLPEIDSEHKHLLGLLNQFAAFLKADDGAGCIGKINEMTTALKSHLENEERIMKGHGYPRLDEHTEKHQLSIRRYDALIKDSARGGYGNTFSDDLISIFADDFIEADMDFKAYLKEVAGEEHPQGQ